MESRKGVPAQLGAEAVEGGGKSFREGDLASSMCTVWVKSDPGRKRACAVGEGRVLERAQGTL